MTDIDEPISESAPSPGQLLLQARERAQLTQEQVAQALHMTLSKVKAIENDDYGKMNADTFVRGYLRSYATLLKIDAGRVIIAYEQLAAAKGLLPLIENLPAKEQSGRKGWGFIASLLVFLVLLLLISVWFFDNRIAPSPTVLPSQAIPPVSAPVSVERLGESTPSTNAESGSDTPSPDLGEPNSTTAAAASVQEVDEGVNTLVPQTQAAALDRLDLVFSDECWLEVSDAQGDVLATDLQRPGSRLTLMGKAPFQVKLGFAAAVSMKLNGESVAIVPQPGAKVLTLSVGE